MKNTSKNTNKNINKKLNTGILIFAAVCIMFTLIITSTTKTSAKQNPSSESSRIFVSIVINEGDTLWSIANQYKPENISTNEYIHELKDINGLINDNIHGGNYLTIYHY